MKKTITVSVDPFPDVLTTDLKEMVVIVVNDLLRSRLKECQICKAPFIAFSDTRLVTCSDECRMALARKAKLDWWNRNRKGITRKEKSTKIA
jgi:hypothetical protein